MRTQVIKIQGKDRDVFPAIKKVCKEGKEKEYYQHNFFFSVRAGV